MKDDGLIVLSIGKITLLCVPEVSADVVCEGACLEIEDLPHRGEEIEERRLPIRK